MKIKISKEELSRLLEIGGGFAGKNRTLPILNCVAISTSNGDISVMSTNSAHTVLVYGVCAPFSDNVSFCIDAADFSKYISLIRDEFVGIEVDGNHVCVGHSEGNMEFSCVPYSDFPAFSQEASIFEKVYDSAKLKKWLSIGSQFVANDEIRPILNSVHLVARDGKEGVMATDTHSMFLDEVASNVEDYTLSIGKDIIPSLMRVLNTTDTITIKDCPTSVIFQTKDIVLSSRKATGVVPAYHRVLPNRNDASTVVTFNRESLIWSLKRTLLSSTLTKFEFTTQSVELIGENLLGGKCTVERMVSANATNNLTIGFNAQMLLNVISCFNDENIYFSLTAPNRAALVYADNTDMVFVVMPMSINS